MAVNCQEIKFIQVCIIICSFHFYDDSYFHRVTICINVLAAEKRETEYELGNITV